ncbi:MucR family transcriptional regulator [Methylobacterium sp. yr668]|uniref:MucR family transcriptional regulator n=1 Tax=Methylobacterium sp. yr668 TaxID=1761801 RepID=UPI0008F185A6|nr:MucR family transcriptional regulator [Methylobacterium sp. yr668]SFS58243.1 transcriptional regulator, MucR family [Methylobacterium sp. yr668]
MPETTTTDLVHLAAGITASYAAGNHFPASALPDVLTAVHGALCGLAQGSAVEAAPAPAADTPSPAEIRKSIRPDGLVSFLDGRSYKTLKRHLTAYGLTPDGYRQRFGLPADYPLVCPSYSAQRSSLAKAMMLGVPGSRSKLQAAE